MCFYLELKCIHVLLHLLHLTPFPSLTSPVVSDGSDIPTLGPISPVTGPVAC